MDKKFIVYKGNKPFEETKEFHELLKTQASRLTNEDIKEMTEGINKLNEYNKLTSEKLKDVTEEIIKTIDRCSKCNNKIELYKLKDKCINCYSDELKELLYKDKNKYFRRFNKDQLEMFHDTMIREVKRYFK